MGEPRVFDGTRFLNVAIHLKPKYGEEEYARTGIGRCYYAVFLPALGILISHGHIPHSQSASDHEAVKNNFGVIDRDGKRDFARLQEWRRLADYRSSWPDYIDLEEIAMRAIDVASSLTQTLTDFRSSR